MVERNFTIRSGPHTTTAATLETARKLAVKMVTHEGGFYPDAWETAKIYDRRISWRDPVAVVMAPGQEGGA